MDISSLPPPPYLGGCLCGAVRYSYHARPRTLIACHCRDCQKASGSAHAANILVPEAQFQWRAGESSVKRFDLAGAMRFAVAFCPQCGTRMPHKIKSTDNVLVPAGVLDADPGMRPQNSIFWTSKPAWSVPLQDMPKFDEYP